MNLDFIKTVYNLNSIAIHMEHIDSETPFQMFLKRAFLNNSLHKAYHTLQFFISICPEYAFKGSIIYDSTYIFCKQKPKYTNVCRLLLLACPQMDPKNLAELNYQARRMAMFLFYAAVPDDVNNFNIFNMFRKCRTGKILIKAIVKYL